MKVHLIRIAVIVLAVVVAAAGDAGCRKPGDP